MNEETAQTADGWTLRICKDDFSYRMTAETIEYLWGRKSKNVSKLIRTDHSITEGMLYWIFITAPRSVVMQLRTHEKSHGSYPWVASARPDMIDEMITQGEYSRDQQLRMVYKLTAREIKEMSHYRMCSRAESPTRRFMEIFKDCMTLVDKEMASQMMPMCEYRNGLCSELKPCGHNRTIEVVKP